MSNILFNIRTFVNSGKKAVATGTLCATCHEAFKPKQSITCHTLQTAAMPAPAFSYYHTHCAPKRGSGWGSAVAGLPVTRPDEVKVGDILLAYSRPFDSYNVVLVTKTAWEGEPADLVGRKFYGIFIAPDTMGDKKPMARQGGDAEFCVWDHEMAEFQREIQERAEKDVGRGHRSEFYRPIIG